jgi:hypothetical protein
VRPPSFPLLLSLFPGENEADGRLCVCTDDVLSVLLTALESRSRLLRGRTGIAPIFLLNNLSYIRHSTLSSSIGDLLGESSEDSLNKKMRTTKANYLEVWSPLVSALLDAGFAEQSGAAGALKAGLGAVKGAGGTERRETKDRFVRFHEALEEVEAVHAQARFEETEVELRERLKGEVERMVVPTYAKFVQKHRKDNCAFPYFFLPFLSLPSLPPLTHARRSTSASTLRDSKPRSDSSSTEATFPLLRSPSPALFHLFCTS